MNIDLVAVCIGAVCIGIVALYFVTPKRPDPYGYLCGQDDDAPQLSVAQKVVLNHMKPGWNVPAGEIANDTGLDRAAVLRAMADLRDLGLATYGPAYSEDDHRLAGRGYALNDNGVAARSKLWQRRAA